ncbi:MAG: hypothetical protein QOF13_1822, partial [Solirubrobacterales bacterium]|nr:hypothetical protein [Solirubrobacterales bacterium]
MARPTVWKRGIAISLPLIVSCVSSLIWLAFAQSAAATVISISYKADWIPLPENEDTPLCAYTGHRVKIVYGGSGVASPATVSDLRSIVNRMNWKIKFMASQSSGGTRPLEMKVDCDASGRPRIYSLGKEGVYAEFGEPDGAQAVKYLVFSTAKGAQGGYTTISGKQEPARGYVKSFSDEPEPSLGSGETADSNFYRTNSSISTVYREANDGTVDFWHSHVPIHELFHGFGAVLQGPPGEPPPGLEGQGHCSDNIDLMCGVYLTTENPCQPGAGSPPYDSPAGVPLDCQFNTYFDSVPEAGEWLSKYWNTGGPEDPFLADPNTYAPEKKSGLEFDLASSADGQLDVVVRSPDSSLRYTARVNGVWNKGWTYLGGSLTSAPVLVSPQPGRLDVFACSYDGTVAHRTLASGVWGEWEALGAGGSPAHCDGLDAVSWAPGRLDVFVRDGGNVYQRSYSASAWGGWSTIASPGNFAVSSLPSVVSRKEGDLLLFVRNGTSDLELRRFSKGAWGAWESLGSPASLPLGTPEAIPNSYGDNAHPFVLGYGGNIFSRRVFDGGAVIWQNQGGGPGTSNAAAIAHSGIVDVYSVSGAGRMQVRRNAYELSTTWQDLGGWFRLAVMPRVVALAGASERSSALAAIGEDGKLYVGTDTDSGWKGWQQVAWPSDVNPSEAFDASEARPWGLRSIPNPPGPNPRPLAVSCNSPDACTAVGAMASESAWAWHWDGAKWTSEGGLPYPIGAQASKLNGVACTSAMSCTAVGQYKNSSGVWRAFAVRWDGSTWSAQTTPSVASGDVTLSSVSCTAANACTAVGSYVSGSKQESLVLRWSGASEWTQQVLPSVKGSGFLKGVSCTSATACQAVGFSGESEAAWRPLAAAWNGSSWSIQTSPSPENMPSSALTSVFCTAANACTAVGYDINPSAREGSLAMRWDGSAWTIQATPQADGTWGYRLNSVTCVSATMCTAIGADGVAPNYSTLALRWDGTRWMEQSTPDPGGATTYGLHGVSCTRSTSCMAVGWQQNGSEYASITEELQGGTPRVTPQPVTGVAKNQATLRSWVNPNGSKATYRFEWGDTTSYGNVAPATPASAGSGLVDFQAEQQIQGIVGEHTY